MPKLEEVITKLESLSNPENVGGMARFGVGGKHTLGISIPILRKMAKGIGRDHGLAAGLWKSGIHEARILASMIDDPERVTKAQAEVWIADFDSWDVTDQVSMNLLEKLPFAWEKAVEWSRREMEFEKRAGFALMACLAWHAKDAPEGKLLSFLPAIEAGADDSRNFVKKAVSWALRNIGKRNRMLNRAAVAAAKRIEKRGTKAAAWIARDALKELTGPAVLIRLNKVSSAGKRGAAAKRKTAARRRG